MKPRYAVGLSLREKDMKRTEKLQGKGVPVIEIFRAGITMMEKMIEARGQLLPNPKMWEADNSEKGKEKR